MPEINARTILRKNDRVIFAAANYDGLIQFTGLEHIFFLNNNIVCSFIFAESDLLPGLGTFVACLVLQLEVGILCGVGLNVLFILYHAARPKISVEKLTVIIDSGNEKLFYKRNNYTANKRHSI